MVALLTSISGNGKAQEMAQCLHITHLGNAEQIVPPFTLHRHLEVVRSGTYSTAKID